MTPHSLPADRPGPTASPPGAATASVRAPLQFIRPQQGKPVLHSSALTGGPPRLLFELEARQVEIADMRPHAGGLSLDREGFELLDAPTAVDDLYDDAAVQTAYRGEVEELIRRRTGARRVVVFDTTRRSDAPRGAANPDGLRGPASHVHVDYTTASGPQRVRDVLGSEAAGRLAHAGTRIVQINLWRPIRGPVLRSPLAVADAASVRPDQLIATDQIFPDRVGEIYYLAHHPGQRWFYAPFMTRDEALLIKGWDSLDDGRARFTPHSAVSLPNTSEEAPPRESIEVRTLAIF